MECGAPKHTGFPVAKYSEEAASSWSPSTTATDSFICLSACADVMHAHVGAASDFPDLELDPSVSATNGIQTMLRVLSTSTPGVPTSSPTTPTGPKGMYMDDRLRREAVSWMVEQQVQLGLHQETLFLAVALLDRFSAASEAIPANYIPLVAATCMCIASKMQGGQVYPVSAYARLVDNSLKDEALMRMETHVLDILQWQCMYPTAWRFLGILNAHLHLPPAVKGMADLLIELSLLEPAFVSCAPLAIAAAAIIQATHTILAAHPQAHTTMLDQLQQLLECPLAHLTTTVNALEALYSMTFDCSIEHPAYPIHQKHNAYRGGACGGMS